MIELRDPDFGDTLTLYQTQTAERSTVGAVQASSLSGGDSQATYLSAIEQSGRLRYSGLLTGFRLSNQSGYSSDPRTALVEWTLQAEAFVDGAQGAGYEFTDTETNTTRSGVIESFEWSIRGGAPFEVEFNFSVVRGEGADPVGESVPDSIGSATDLVIDGQTVDTYRELQVEKSEEADEFRRAFADSPDDNDVLTDGGVTREITVVGRVSGDANTRLAFDDAVSASIGDDAFITISEPFTGRTFTGMINDYESSREAGITRLGDFSVTVIEGSPNIDSLNIK
jgi:hypothetical protein